MKKNISIFLIAVIIAVVLFTSFREIENRKKIQTITKAPNEESFSETSGEVLSVMEIIESGEEWESGEESGEPVIEEAVKEIRKNEEPEEDPSIIYSNQNGSSLKSTTPYYIKVNNLQNVVTIYQKDEEGNYTIPYKAMLCSTGIATPKAGSAHKVTTYKNRWNGLEGNVYGQYATQIIGDILFHSVPYTARNNSSLEYWEYDKLGTSASLGCVRLNVEDAKWIYDNISSGTVVEFYEDENPGPLGKPEGQKITENEELRGWDPTDPDAKNPWNPKSVEEDVKVEEEITPIKVQPAIEFVNPVVSSGENEDETIMITSGDTKEEEKVYGEKETETKTEEEKMEKTNSEEPEMVQNDNIEDDWIGSRK